MAEGLQRENERLAAEVVKPGIVGLGEQLVEDLKRLVRVAQFLVAASLPHPRVQAGHELLVPLVDLAVTLRRVGQKLLARLAAGGMGHRDLVHRRGQEQPRFEQVAPGLVPGLQPLGVLRVGQTLLQRQEHLDEVLLRLGEDGPGFAVKIPRFGQQPRLLFRRRARPPGLVHLHPPPLDQDVGQVRPRRGRHRVIGMIAKEFLEPVASLVQGLGPSRTHAKQSRTAHQRDAGLVVDHRLQVGRAIGAGGHPVQIRQRHVAQPALAQPVEKRPPLLDRRGRPRGDTQGTDRHAHGEHDDEPSPGSPANRRVSRHLVQRRDGTFHGLCG